MNITRLYFKTFNISLLLPDDILSTDFTSATTYKERQIKIISKNNLDKKRTSISM